MNEITIDSLKVRIPIEQVTVIDATIFSHKLVIDGATGEIEKEFEQKRFRHNYDGITTSFGIEEQVTGEQKVKKYLVVLYNSKLLHERYFEGITSDNIRLVYDRIIALKKVSFSYESFLDSAGTDVDYKLDTEVKHFDKSIKKLYSHVKPTKKVGRGCNCFDKMKNKGIEFGKRETSTPASPYLKIYHKGLELVHNSSIFYRKYLKGAGDYSNKVRLEFTIKNRKHFKKYCIEDTSLRSILSIKQTQLEGIVKSILSTHIEPRMIDIKAPTDMTPMDATLYNAIVLLMHQGLNYNLIRESLVQSSTGVAKSRQRRKLDSIYESAIRGLEVDSISQEQANFFEAIGWG